MSDISSPNKNLRGVGGWLAFFILSAIVIQPLLGVLTTLGSFSQTEFAAPGLRNLQAWSEFKTATLISVLAACGLWMYAGYKLWREHKPSSVSFMIYTMWGFTLIYPIVNAVIFLLYFPNIAVGQLTLEVIRFFLAGLIVSTIWTIYLKKSRRVKNTYFVFSNTGLNLPASEFLRNGNSHAAIQRHWGILSLSVVMFITTLFSIEATGQKTSPYLLFWCYVGFLAYKGDIDKIFTWTKTVCFVNVAGLVLITIFVSSDSTLFRTFGLGSKFELLIGISIPLAIKTGLLIYLQHISGGRLQIANFRLFFPEERYSATSQDTPSKQADESLWSQAASEFDSPNRKNGLWAKCFALADGDENRAKSLYLKERVLQLAVASPPEVFTNPENEVNARSVKANSAPEPQTKRTGYGLLFFLALPVLGIAILIFWAFLDSESSRSTASSAIKSELSPIAISAKGDWKGNVSILRHEIAEQRIQVAQIKVKSLQNYFDAFDDSEQKITYTEDKVNQIESENIWWVENNTIFIRLHNPERINMIGIVFSLAKDNCTSDNRNPKKFLLFDLRSNPIKGRSYSVISADLPFDYHNNFGGKTSCGIVEQAFGNGLK